VKKKEEISEVAWWRKRSTWRNAMAASGSQLAKAGG